MVELLIRSGEATNNEPGERDVCTPDWMTEVIDAPGIVAVEEAVMIELVLEVKMEEVGVAVEASKEPAGAVAMGGWPVSVRCRKYEGSGEDVPASKLSTLSMLLMSAMVIQTIEVVMHRRRC